jgi:phosphoribosylformylglycinamidine (FGAM) synthase-like enzyme
MMFQVAPHHVPEVLAAIESQGAKAAVIGEITEGTEAVFVHDGEIVARIPHHPPAGF